MKCKYFCEIITAYVDAEAKQSEEEALLKHIESCEKCKEILRSHHSLKEMIEDCKKNSSCKVDVSGAVMKKIQCTKTRKRKCIIIGLILVAIAAGLFFYFQTGESQQADPAAYIDILNKHITAVNDLSTGIMK